MTVHACAMGGTKSTPGWAVDAVLGDAFGYDWATAEPPC